MIMRLILGIFIVVTAFEIASEIIHTVRNIKKLKSSKKPKDDE